MTTTGTLKKIIDNYERLFQKKEYITTDEQAIAYCLAIIARSMIQ